MSVDENKKVIRNYVLEMWNQHRLDVLAGYVAADLLPEVGEHNSQFLIAFPDVQVTIQDMIAEDDKVVARLSATATNTGPFAGRPPTGKRITFGSIRIFRLANGKIVETWAMQDRLGLMEQLGHVQSPGTVNWAAGPNRSPGG